MRVIRPLDSSTGVLGTHNPANYPLLQANAGVQQIRGPLPPLLRYKKGSNGVRFRHAQKALKKRTEGPACIFSNGNYIALLKHCIISQSKQLNDIKVFYRNFILYVQPYLSFVRADYRICDHHYVLQTGLKSKKSTKVDILASAM